MNGTGMFPRPRLALRVLAVAGALFASDRLFADTGPTTAAGKPAECDLEPFLGEPRLEVQQVFSGERFPNIVVTTEGTVIATWGRNSYRVRRSEDGGQTWGPEITVAEPGFHGGGAVVDERSGDVLVFVEAGHPPAPLTVFRSSDDGRTWHTSAPFPANGPRAVADGSTVALHLWSSGTPRRARLGQGADPRRPCHATDRMGAWRNTMAPSTSER